MIYFYISSWYWCDQCLLEGCFKKQIIAGSIITFFNAGAPNKGAVLVCDIPKKHLEDQLLWVCPLLLTLQGWAGQDSDCSLPPVSVLLIRLGGEAAVGGRELRQCMKMLHSCDKHNSTEKARLQIHMVFFTYGFWPGSHLFSEVMEGLCPELPYTFLSLPSSHTHIK